MSVVFRGATVRGERAETRAWRGDRATAGSQGPAASFGDRLDVGVHSRRNRVLPRLLPRQGIQKGHGLHAARLAAALVHCRLGPSPPIFTPFSQTQEPFPCFCNARKGR